MGQNTIVKLFFGFLKINNVYNEFLANYREGKLYWVLYEDMQLENILKDNLEEAINCAFEWASTPQHRNFWYTLNNEWVNLFYKFKIYYEKYYKSDI